MRESQWLPNSMTVKEALSVYFTDNDLGNGGYKDRWVVFKMGRVPIIAIPNTKSRKATVPLHDQHHVLTGYKADWRGEAEISAWELAAGCHGFTVAWVLDLGGMSLGLVGCPKRTIAAFLRGCESRSLYADPTEPKLDRTLGELRTELGIPPLGERVEASPRNRKRLITFSIAALLYGLCLPLSVCLTFLALTGPAPKLAPAIS